MAGPNFRLMALQGKICLSNDDDIPSSPIARLLQQPAKRSWFCSVEQICGKFRMVLCKNPGKRVELAFKIRDMNIKV